MPREIPWDSQHGEALANLPHAQPKPMRFDITVITPMFGGGVISGEQSPTENDPVTPIRGSEIRGQLRFWWRAIRGARFERVDDLANEEFRIWGGCHSAAGNKPTPSMVSFNVEGVAPSPERHPYPVEYSQFAMQDQLDKKTGNVKWDPSGKPKREPNTFAYAMFPFQQNETKSEAIGVQNIDFRLWVTCPNSVKADVEAAIWGWLAFGGMGARTRRGCGSLWSQSNGSLATTATLPKVKKWFRQSFQKHTGTTESHVREWPTLSNTILLGSKIHQCPLDAWKEALELFRNFRQGVDRDGKGPGVAREGKGPTFEFPGPSFWPEPENIRRATGTSFTHAARQPDMPQDLFPRAELGLPIITHFRHSDLTDPHVKPEDSFDPADTVLLPGTGDDKKNRMASPLIIKPLGIGGRQFVALIARLNVEPLEMVTLDWVQPPAGWEYDEHHKPKPITEGFVRDPDFAKYKRSPVRNRSPEGSALEAFWTFAQQRGFTQVSAEEAQS